MADAQIAIIDGDQTQVVLAPGENPAIVTSIPGPQGPAGAGVPLGGTTNQVLFKQSGTNYDTAWGPITSAMIGDLEIVNADVSASAAIAGTKISPNFGSQNVTTTGTSTAASFIPTSSTAPTNGLYLSAANSVALSTNGTGRLFIDSSGNVGINTTSATAYGMNLAVVGTVGLIPSTFGAVGTSVSVRSQLGAAGGEEIVRNEITSFANASNYGTATIFTTRNGASVGERLRITSAGLVGIGTSAPAADLDIGGGSSGNKSIRLQTLGGSTVINLVTNNQVNASYARINNTYGSTNEWFIGGLNDGVGGKLALGVANSARMTIDSSGRVGIGTQSPGDLLHVYGPTPVAIIEGTSGFSGITLKNSGGATKTTSLVSQTSGLGQIQSESLRFVNVGATVEYGRWDSSGRLLVGTSSSTASVGQTAQLQVAGSARITSGLASTIDVGSIAQNATTAIALSRSGMYCIYVGTMNLFALFVATINGGSQGVRLIYSTASDVVAGLTTEPAGGTYLRLWISGQQLQVKNVNAFTGPYFITALATGD